MEQKKDVIYVPYWIVSMLERNNLPLSTVLDYRKMAQFLPAQEQANMLLFEDFTPFKEKIENGRHQPQYGMMELQTGTDITNYPMGCPLYEAWRKCVYQSQDANDKQLFNNLETMNSLSWSETTKQELAMRFDPANAGRITHTQPFITYDVEREFVIVVVYPAFFESTEYNTNVIDLCKAVLKVLYVYNTPASGCKTPYFRKYLESLS